METKCKGCGEHPSELGEYKYLAEDMGVSPEEAMIEEEGTYNPRTGLFYCTQCYMRAGMPLGKA